MPNTPKDDLDVRLSVAETKVTNIEDEMSEQKIVLRDISVKVDGLKERFDKMNGTLPHIQEACNNIEKHMGGMVETIHKQDTRITKNTLYMKIIWAITIPTTVAIVGALIKIFFGN